MPQSLQFHAQIALQSVGCQESGECAKSCARRSVCFNNQSGGDSSVRPLT
jgi:hypothetical protein